MLFVFILLAGCAMHQVQDTTVVPAGLVAVANQAEQELNCRLEYRVYDPICSGIDYCSFSYGRHNELQVYFDIPAGQKELAELPESWPLMRGLFEQGIGYVELTCRQGSRKEDNYYLFALADFPKGGMLQCQFRLEDGSELACYLDNWPETEWPVQWLAQWPPTLRP